MLRALMNLFTSDEGQTMAEYALILALIAIIVIVALIFLGNTIRDFFYRIGNNINST